MDFGWWWCVRVGTSVLTIIPVWWRMFIMGEVWGRKGVYGKSLSFLPNFAVNLKLLFKNRAYLKWYVYILKGWLQKSVGHRISRMTFGLSDQHLGRVERHNCQWSRVPEEFVSMRVHQCGPLIYSQAHFPTLSWLGWTGTSSGQWNGNGDGLHHFLAKARTHQCLDLRASLPLLWPWQKCTWDARVERSKQSALPGWRSRGQLLWQTYNNASKGLCMKKE